MLIFLPIILLILFDAALPRHYFAAAASFIATYAIRDVFVCRHAADC